MNELQCNKCSFRFSCPAEQILPCPECGGGVTIVTGLPGKLTRAPGLYGSPDDPKVRESNLPLTEGRKHFVGFVSDKPVNPGSKFRVAQRVGQGLREDEFFKVDGLILHKSIRDAFVVHSFSVGGENQLAGGEPIPGVAFTETTDWGGDLDMDDAVLGTELTWEGENISDKPQIFKAAVTGVIWKKKTAEESMPKAAGRAPDVYVHGPDGEEPAGVRTPNEPNGSKPQLEPGMNVDGTPYVEPKDDSKESENEKETITADEVGNVEDILPNLGTDR